MNNHNFVFCVLVSIISLSNLQSQIIGLNEIYCTSLGGSTTDFDNTTLSLEVTNLNLGCNEGLGLQLDKDIFGNIFPIEEGSLEIEVPEIFEDDQKIELDLNSELGFTLVPVNSETNSYILQWDKIPSAFSLLSEQPPSPPNTIPVDPLDIPNNEIKIIFPTSPPSNPSIHFDIDNSEPDTKYFIGLRWLFGSIDVEYEDELGNTVLITGVESLELESSITLNEDNVNLNITTCNIPSFDIVNGSVTKDPANSYCILENGICLDNGCSQWGGNCNNDCDCVALAKTVPTLSQWGLILLALLLLTICSISVVRQRETTLAMSGGTIQRIKAPLFNMDLFKKTALKSIPFIILAISLISMIEGELFTRNIIGTIISGLIISYLIHFIVLSGDFEG